MTDSPKKFEALFHPAFNLDETKENYYSDDSQSEFTQESTQLVVDEGLSYYDSSLDQSPVSYEEMKAWLATPKPKPKREYPFDVKSNTL